jgi:hypothetical protein
MDKVRIQLDFSPRAVKELDEMKELMDVSSRAEVVRHALRWTRWTVLNIANGGRLLLEKDGQQQEVVLPFATPDPAAAGVWSLPTRAVEGVAKVVETARSVFVTKAKP